MFDSIANDKEIINLYNKISIFEDKNKGQAYHDYNHVIKTSLLIEKVLNELAYDKDYIEEAKIAAILHDTGCLEGKDGHPLRGYVYSKDYFKRKGIKLHYEDEVLNAVKNHSSGFEDESIMTRVLIFADKLDVTKSRLAMAGYDVIGARHMQNIEDVIVSIKNEILTVEFIVNENFDRDEFFDWYFGKKILKGIINFANGIKHQHIILINKEKLI